MKRRLHVGDEYAIKLTTHHERKVVSITVNENQRSLRIPSVTQDRGSLVRLFLQDLAATAVYRGRLQMVRWGDFALTFGGILRAGIDVLLLDELPAGSCLPSCLLIADGLDRVSAVMPYAVPREITYAFAVWFLDQEVVGSSAYEDGHLLAWEFLRILGHTHVRPDDLLTSLIYTPKAIQVR